MLLKFETESAYTKFKEAMVDVTTITKKMQVKYKLDILYFSKIMSLANSFRDEFTKKKNMHALELLFDDDRVLYLACYDSDQLRQWLTCIKKAMHFHEWFRSLKTFLADEMKNESLTEKVSIKLSEMIQFFQQYSRFEKVQIEFVTKEIAMTRDRKKNLLRRQDEVLASMREEKKSFASDEFKTPDGSFEDGEQGMPSPQSTKGQQ